MRSLSQAILLIVIFFTTTNSFAQVTIGSGNIPNAGALLDLKQHSDGTSNKGMILPRVSLTDVDNLFPMFETSPGSGIANANYTGTLKDAEDEKHTGLMVYNTNDVGTDFCKGIYLWSGNEWVRIPEPCAKARFDTDNLLFYKSALAAKIVTLEMSHNNASVLWTDDGVIPLPDWQIYPSNLTRGVSKVFAFQPKVNNTGGDRTTIVTATVNIDDKTYVQPIRITQLDREMTYSLNPVTFAPQGNTHTVTATTEASSWRAGITSTNPGTMISGLADNTNRPNNGTMRITFADNPTWAERIAKLNITSTDPHFMGREIEVKQTAAAPLLTRTGSGAINLTSAQNVDFNTNAQWQFAVQSGDYNNVVGSAALNSTAITAGTTQGSTTPVTTRATSVTFNPSTSEPAPGNYTTTVRFSALNTTPQAAPAPFDVVMNRTVGARFAFNSLKIGSTAITSIARAGGDITVNVSTNAAWKATATSGTASANQNPGTYGEKTATINIGANTNWSATTSPANRDITVSTVYGNNTSSMSTSGGSKTLTQPGYYISAASTNLTALNANTATNVNVSLTGAYPNMTNYIRAFNVTGNAVLKTGTIAGGESGARSVTLSVPANLSWYSRSVRMDYYHPGVSNGSGGFGVWKTVGSAVTQQSGYDLSYNSTTFANPIKPAGQTANIVLKTTKGNNLLTLRATFATSASTASVVTKSNGIAANTGTNNNIAVNSIAIPAMPNNTWGWTNDRTITFQDSRYGGGTNASGWNTLHSITQKRYDLSFKSTTFANPIKATGQTANMVLQTTNGNAQVTLRATYPTSATTTGTVTKTVTANAAANNNIAINSIAIPAMPVNTWGWTTDRTITFQDSRHGGGTNASGWNTLRTITQKRYDLAVANGGTNGNVANNLPPAASTNVYYVTTSTTNGCPNFVLRVSTGISNNQPYGTNYDSSSGGVGKRYFNVPRNESGTQTRTLYFWVQRNGYTWHYVGAFTQGIGNFKLPISGRIVAKVDIREAGKSIWNYAMGIPATYNENTYPHQNWLNYTQDYNTTQKTGCAAYSEPGYPAGTWRVPTESEAVEMINHRANIPAFDATSPHWTSTEKSATTLKLPMLNPNNAATNPTIVYYDEFYGNAARKKYLTLSARCVRYP